MQPDCQGLIDSRDITGETTKDIRSDRNGIHLGDNTSSERCHILLQRLINERLVIYCKRFYEMNL